MLLNTTRFGKIVIGDEEIITFNEGLPGLESLKQFVLLSHTKEMPFKWLQSIEDKDIALIVINPFLYLAEYNIDIGEDVIQELNITDMDNAAVFSVAVIPQDIKKMTSNFVAPIIVNVENRLAKQVILVNSNYSVRTPIYDLYLSVKAQEAV